jgi:hypothetical protein
MKSLFISLLIPLASGCLSPGLLRAQEFRTVQGYSEWVMTYQENPEPAKLYPAFAFGVTNRAIARAGGRKPLVAFFGAVLRADSSLLPTFYERVAQAPAADVHYGFASALWMANTPASRRCLEQYLRLGRGRPRVARHPRLRHLPRPPAAARPTGPALGGFFCHWQSG